MDMQQIAPSMMNYPDPPEFDYGAFLQAEDVGFSPGQQQQQPPPQSATAALYSDSSPGKPTPNSSDNHTSPNVGTEIVARQSGTSSGSDSKQRLERRGHTKSRRGCYNCKRRRIKCQENRPACGHCVKTGLKCEYPSLPQITHQPHHQIPLFSLQDMRFFQHFLTQCYPHHPLKQEEIWTHEIPCIAHNHEFLMHALLGYAASELISSDPGVITAAMNHRVKAIRAIKKRLTDSAKMSTTYEEANALVATCFALTFQSVSLEDGLPEFMTFIRGIMVVGMQMMFRGIKPIFDSMLEPDQNAILEPYMSGLPLIERGWADAASESIRNLRPLCIEPVELDYQEKLMIIADMLYVSSWDAYRALSRQYGWWMLLPHGTFQELINPNNQVMLLLHAHWIAMSQIMAFITEREYEVRQKHPDQHGQRTNDPDPGFVRWLHFMNSRVDYEHQMYNQWPMWVDEQLQKDITFFGRRK